MDAFYASVEQRNHPELKGKPIAVGHAEKRGVVAAASYEARKFGVRSAMPSQQAIKICPQLIFVEGHMETYKQVSAQIHQIFHDYTDLIEPISLDEAFLDVTENKKGIELAVDIAREIKRRIREELHLIASAGISYNKFLAKVASDYRKPDGLCTIHPKQAQEFIDRLPIEQFWGVGPVTAKKCTVWGSITEQPSDNVHWTCWPASLEKPESYIMSLPVESITVQWKLYESASPSGVSTHWKKISHYVLL